jgi:hypothetical protein
VEIDTASKKRESQPSCGEDGCVWCDIATHNLFLLCIIFWLVLNMFDITESGGVENL